MSRGLGKRQTLLLRSLESLTAEYGPGHFHVFAIVNRAYDLDDNLRARAQQRQDSAAAVVERLERDAAAGDDFASYTLTLRALLSRRRDARGRRQERQHRDLERDLNPTRLLASLHRRGLVDRGVFGACGAYALTDQGAAMCRTNAVGK